MHEWEYDVKDEPKKVVNELGEISFDRKEPVENLVTWVYEEGSFIPCAKLIGNEYFSIVSDYVGRPVLAFDKNGEKVWSTEYDIYGNLRNLQGDRNFVPFRQLGQYEDCETGLYYNRFRYYDSFTGTYISKDPIGLLGGFALYGYVKDINKYVDIFGLFAKGDYFEMPSYYKYGYQKHHIIPRTLKHPLLERLGYDVHQSRNIVYLPMSEEIDPTRTVHNGPHNKIYEIDILNQLDAINNLDADDYIKKMHIDNLTDNLRDDLLNKRIKLNCH